MDKKVQQQLMGKIDQLLKLPNEERIREIVEEVVAQQMMSFRQLIADELQKNYDPGTIPKRNNPNESDASGIDAESDVEISIEGKKIQYTTIPVNNIFFARNIYDEIIQRKTFYRIILANEEALEGYLDLVNDEDTLITAFQLPDSNLVACELRGVGLPAYEKMQSKRVGKVHRDGNNWVVQKKIVVVYGD
jgi:hypothetical protein